MPGWKNRIVGQAEVEPSTLVPNPQNWRIHGALQSDAMAGILHEVGWVQRIIVNQRTSLVLDGHLRLKLALDRKESLVPVLYVDLSEGEEALVLSTLDPLSALAETDKGMLATLLGDVSSGETGIQRMLAQLAEQEGIVAALDAATPVVDVEPEIDRAEELRQQYGVELGQLWACGVHRVICGDCTDKRVVESVMGGAQAQMIFTDPPYGVDYDGGMKKRQRLDNDGVGTAIYTNALPVLASAVDTQAPLYLWYADAHAAAAAAAAAAAGYVIVAQIIWAKNHAQFMSSAHYHGKHEPCFYGHKRGKSARWYGPDNEVTLWEYDRSPSNDYHPTQKPVSLAARALTNSTAPGDAVLDGFLGGGSTLIAAQQLSRRCYGIEIDPGYVAVTLHRWATLTGETPLLIEG